jgi:hypothetical protein
MALLNADQAIEPKQRVKQYLAIDRQDFAPKTMVIRQRGREHVYP